MMKVKRGPVATHVSAALSLILCAVSVARGQDRLRSMPGFERYQRIAPLVRTAVSPIVLGFGNGVSWSPDGRSFEYDNGGKHYRFDIATKNVAEFAEGAATRMSAGGGRAGRGGGGGQPARGRQFDFSIAPVG